MMFDSIFVKRGGYASLEEFSRGVFKVLHVTEIEERLSANYQGGRYFAGIAFGLSLTVAEADDVGYEDYDFWLLLKEEGPWVEDNSYLQGCGDMIARILTRHGYEVVRALNWSGRQSVIKRMRYKREWIGPFTEKDPPERIRQEITTQSEDVVVNRQ